MTDLREDLDRALRTLPVGPAPVERARRDGCRLRTRRRLGVLAGVVAVAAVAAVVPVLARSTALAPSLPVTGQPYGGDPVLTAAPPASATEGPDGMTDTNGVIAQGSYGGQPWKITVTPSGPARPAPAYPCYEVTAPLSLTGGAHIACSSLPLLSGQGRGTDPATLGGFGFGGAGVIVGEASSDVTYFIVTFTDGQRLKLLPVTVAGHRYFGWLASPAMTVGVVEAHLGSAYADSGQVATIIPFQPAGRLPAFSQWQLPG